VQQLRAAASAKRSTPSRTRRESLELPGTQGRDAEGSGYPFSSPEEAAATVAWQQQMYYQQQLAIAETLTPRSKQKHMGEQCLCRALRRQEAVRFIYAAFLSISLHLIQKHPLLLDSQTPQKW